MEGKEKVHQARALVLDWFSFLCFQSGQTRTHACLRRLIDLSCSVSSLNHHISLNADSRADICWWIDFLPSWNGVNFMHTEPITSVSLSLFTDASGVGFGALYGCKWFSAEWAGDLEELSY